MLPNGLTVLVKEVRNAPVVSFSVWYRAGSRNEHTGITGVSHLLEHMLFKGTKQYRLGEIARTLFLNGASFNASTYYDWTNYYATIAADRLELAMRDRGRPDGEQPDRQGGPRRRDDRGPERAGGRREQPGPAPLAGGGLDAPSRPIPTAGRSSAGGATSRTCPATRSYQLLPDPLRPEQRGRGRRRRRRGRRGAPAGPEALRPDQADPQAPAGPHRRAARSAASGA